LAQANKEPKAVAWVATVKICYLVVLTVATQATALGSLLTQAGPTPILRNRHDL